MHVLEPHRLRFGQKYHPLPRDLRDFYLTTNGMLLRWSMRQPDGSVARLGRLSISPIESLEPVPTKVRWFSRACVIAWCFVFPPPLL